MIYRLEYKCKSRLIVWTSLKDGKIILYGAPNRKAYKKARYRRNIQRTIETMLKHKPYLIGIGHCGIQLKR